MRNLKRPLFVIPLILAAVLLSTTYTQLASSKPISHTSLKVKYFDGKKLILDDGTTYELEKVELPTPKEVENTRLWQCFIFSLEKYQKLKAEGKLGPVKSVQIFKLVEEIRFIDLPDGSFKEVRKKLEPPIEFVFVEPLFCRESSISGTLEPGTGIEYYFTYTFAHTIGVYVTWSPSDQILGIGIYYPRINWGYVRWETDGQAHETFIGGGSWEYSEYYILILSHPSNTKAIQYSGTIIFDTAEPLKIAR